MLTIDVEQDWGASDTRAVREVLPRFVRLLDDFGSRATFFVVGELADLVRLHLPPDGPHEVASHGLTHRLLTRLSTAQLEAEVWQSKERLEAAGYRVQGFRAPFFVAPRGLRTLLAGAGYSYDASEGHLVPRPLLRSRRVSRCGPNGLWRVPTGTLGDGMTPFSLTWLRLLHPFGLRLVTDRGGLFYCHLHELLEGTGGWSRLPSVLRRLHRRCCGTAALEIVGALLKRFGPRFVTCREFLALEQG